MTRMSCVFLVLMFSFFSISLQAKDKKNALTRQPQKTQFNNDESDAANRLLVIIKKRNKHMKLR